MLSRYKTRQAIVPWAPNLAQALFTCFSPWVWKDYKSFRVHDRLLNVFSFFAWSMNRRWISSLIFVLIQSHNLFESFPELLQDFWRRNLHSTPPFLQRPVCRHSWGRSMWRCCCGYWKKTCLLSTSVIQQRLYSTKRFWWGVQATKPETLETRLKKKALKNLGAPKEGKLSKPNLLLALIVLQELKERHAMYQDSTSNIIKRHSLPWG